MLVLAQGWGESGDRRAAGGCGRREGVCHGGDDEEHGETHGRKRHTWTFRLVRSTIRRSGLTNMPSPGNTHRARVAQKASPQQKRSIRIRRASSLFQLQPLARWRKRRRKRDKVSLTRTDRLLLSNTKWKPPRSSRCQACGARSDSRKFTSRRCHGARGSGWPKHVSAVRAAECGACSRGRPRSDGASDARWTRLPGAWVRSKDAEAGWRMPETGKMDSPYTDD